MRSQQTEELSRRQFIKRAAIVAVALPVLPLGFAAWRGSDKTTSPASAQEWAGAADGPLTPTWKTRITDASEPGAPLLISGTIFQPDGVTPAKGITLYVYHTDTKGYYSQETSKGTPPKPRLRGWMRTGADGRYEFHTIRPGSYPGTNAPQHIHASLSGPGYTEYWIDNYFFEDDPFISAEHRSTLSGRGGFQSIIALKRDADGWLRGTRNLKLERV